MRGAPKTKKRRVAALLAIGLVIAVVLAAATSGLGHPGVPAGDVAIVEGVDPGTVSQDEFDRALQQAATQLGLQTVPPTSDPQYASLRDQAMQGLLLQVWVEGEAADRGIEVSQDDIDAELARIKKQSFSSEKEFQQFVKSSNFTPEDIQRQVRLTLLRQRLEAEVVTAPDIRDDEVKDFYDTNIDSFKQPASRDVRVILNSDQAQVETAKQELTADPSPENWKKVAAKYSQDQASKDRGGLLQGLVQGQGDPQLEAQAFSAAQGELVGPFKTDRGYYLVEADKITDATTTPLDQASDGIRQQLVSARQQKIAADFQDDFVSKWSRATTCKPEDAIVFCRNYEAPAPTQVPGQPLPPAVPGTQPLEPGTVTLSLDGSVQRGLPQGPVSPPPPAASQLPAGSLPIGPGGAPVAPPPTGSAPPPTGSAPPPPAAP